MGIINQVHVEEIELNAEIYVVEEEQNELVARQQAWQVISESRTGHASLVA